MTEKLSFKITNGRIIFSPSYDWQKGISFDRKELAFLQNALEEFQKKEKIWPFRLDNSQLTDRGKQRKSNEDSLLALPEIGCFAVADGVGGNNAGEIASKITVDVLAEEIPKLEFSKKVTELQEDIGRIFDQINENIYNSASHDLTRQGMASTLACVILLQKKALVAHVGDSRVYLIRNERIERLTKDHALPSEKKTHAITRALGAASSVQPDLRTFDAELDDVYLLTTDGITDHVNDNELLIFLKQSSTLDIGIENIKNACYQRGAHDNLTVVAIHLSGRNESHHIFEMHLQDDDIPTIIK